MQEKIFLTISEALERLALSRTSLYREVREGRLKLVKRGRRSFILVCDAEAWTRRLPYKAPARLVTV